MTQQRILIVSLDVVGENMAGPAIRCWEIARILGRGAQVTLAIPNAPSIEAQNFALVRYDGSRLESLASESDLVIVSGHALWFYPFLKRLEIPLVIDIYDPFALESLPLLAGQPEGAQVQRYGIILDALTDLITWGDFFLCASEKQRDYWLGWLNAVNRINPTSYRQSPDLRELVDVVPFGLPEKPPEHTLPVLKGVHPGIAETDRVILWAGGVYNWFDPLTLIRALERIWAQREDVKLFFLGICHPTHGDTGAEMAQEAIALSRSLGLLDKAVFFNDWVPYRKRQNYLLEADLGASLHFAHVETRFSFRTRLLDYIWAGLPMMVTQGDVLSDLVESHHLGWTVGYEDLDGVTDAILQGLDVHREEFRDRFAAVAQELTWEKVLQPLVSFCRNPRLAPDRHLQGDDLQALPTLKLVSLIDALRRDINQRDEQIATLNHLLRESQATASRQQATATHQQARIADLQAELEAIKQGRVMRLMNRVDRMFKPSQEKND
jgi:glycosyltransferase involved in cell wall biosynthesis